MPSRNPRPKPPAEAALDHLENGLQPHSDSSLAIVGTESAQTKTPESRTNLELDDTPARNSSLVAIRWKIRDKVPAPITRCIRKAVEWAKGPQPSKTYHINPVLEAIQIFPLRLLSCLPKAGHAVLLLAVFVLWVVLFAIFLSKNSLPNNIGGAGAPVRLSCISRLWSSPQACGLDGRNCMPFDESNFAFLCPANCASVQVLNPWTIGDEQIVYRPLVVGGTPDATEAGAPVYRGDSFICSAAIHAGVLTDVRGGCGAVSLTGEKSSFGSIQRNGISSVGFNSSFPLSFAFSQEETVAASAGKCGDPRWNLLILSTIFTAVLSLLTNTPASFFVPIFIIVFFQVVMASDPPPYTDYPSLASTAVGSFLPAAFIGVLIYQFVVKRTLRRLSAQIEKTILWLGGCWVGALSNITLDMIPIQRLTPHDINQQPGAIAALVIIVLVLVCIALYQAWCFRNEGRLLRYLSLYATVGIGLGVLVAIPRLNLRIHHYILALLLLPGTSLQTRLSLLYQGLLVGLFINGVARWGFAPVLQTTAALRGDARLGFGIPSIQAPIFNSTASGGSITFAWDTLARGYDGVSVLVNDVERFRGRGKEGHGEFTWRRRDWQHAEFFRFGFVSYQPFGTVTYSDFTLAGTWWPNGTWSGIPPGLS